MRGSIEIATFAIPERRDHRIMVSVAGACVSALAHFLFFTLLIWGPPKSAPQMSFARAVGDGPSDLSDDNEMEWLALDSSAAGSDRPSFEMRGEPDLTRIEVRVRELHSLAASLDASEERDTPADASNVTADDRGYFTQIAARVDRAWLRPQTSIGSDHFICQVRIAQDIAGNVTEVLLERCNGTPNWQVSLVHAIESASPLPAPADPRLFRGALHMRFQADGPERAANPSQPVQVE